MNGISGRHAPAGRSGTVALLVLLSALSGCLTRFADNNENRNENANAPRCGNGVQEGDESCDGTDFAGADCVTQGFLGGTLACGSDCDYDVSSCFDESCGNGVQEGGESCDGSDLADETCQSAAGHQSGALRCNAECGFDVSGCHTCGDDERGGPEECDGPDLGPATCATVTQHTQGDLACLENCTFDTTGCHTCGNDVLEPAEVCDGALLSTDCQGLGHGGGQLACDSNCNLDESGCWDCGDGLCELTKGEGADTCASDCGWTAVSAGEEHTCALKGDSTAWCWGSNNAGQLGLGYLNGPEDCGDYCSTQPIEVTGLTDEVVQITAGSWHSCALLGSGTVWCWGGNNHGELGLGSTQGPEDCHDAEGRDCSTIPRQVPGLVDVIFVDAGDEHTCVIKNDGSAWCWGEGGSGRLGDSGTWDEPSPVQVLGFADGAWISAGLQHTCAVTNSGAAWCWGDNQMGQLGDDSNTDRATPVAVHNLTDVTAISAGGFHTCARKIDGTAWCWGGNDQGELGLGHESNRDTPQQVTSLSNVICIEAGGTYYYNATTGYDSRGFSCAATDQSATYCWGNNNDGQLGIDSYGDQDHPTAVSLLSPSIKVTTGSNNHACAVTVDGRAWCWGRNNQGQLGDGTENSHDAPVQVVDPY